MKHAGFKMMKLNCSLRCLSVFVLAVAIALVLVPVPLLRRTGGYRFPESQR
jgi:hypothetical protein